MKIVLITQGISRVVHPLVESRDKVLAIVEAAPRGLSKRRLLKSFIRKILALENILKSTPATLKGLGKKKNIPYRFMNPGRDLALAEWLKSLNPDLIVVFSMSQLLSEDIFSIPKLGTINLHPSFLPEFRGPNPDFWQYYYQVLSPGVTVHFIDKGEDTGDIIIQERVSLPLGVKSPERLDKLIGEIGIKILLKAIDALENGSYTRITQPKESPTPRARIIKKTEHRSLIDWNEWPIERVWHLMRGTELWLDCIDQPNGLYRGQRWVVGDYEKFEMTNYSESPGSVMKDSTGYYVRCRDGKIRLQRRFTFKALLRFFWQSVFD